jgi:hypothetical protein
VFAAVGTALLIGLFFASLPNENGPDNSTLALAFLALISAAFFLASAASLGYAREATPKSARRAVISGVIAVVPSLLWIVIWAAQSSA